MKEIHMRKIAQLINEAIEASDSPKKIEEIRRSVLELTRRFPLYPELAKW
jgi:glycine/serine hydroxymethyltransferase